MLKARPKVRCCDCYYYHYLHQHTKELGIQEKCAMEIFHLFLCETGFCLLLGVQFKKCFVFVYCVAVGLACDVCLLHDRYYMMKDSICNFEKKKKLSGLLIIPRR